MVDTRELQSWCREWIIYFISIICIAVIATHIIIHHEIVICDPLNTLLSILLLKFCIARCRSMMIWHSYFYILLRIAIELLTHTLNFTITRVLYYSGFLIRNKPEKLNIECYQNSKRHDYMTRDFIGICFWRRTLILIIFVVLYETVTSDPT